MALNSIKTFIKSALFDPVTKLIASIKQDPETLSNELLMLQENHICPDNTTSTLLLAGATFTGDWQNHLSFQEINISIDTDQDSATDGFIIQWSADGITVADTDTFSVYADAGTNYTPNPAFQFVRVIFTNGAVNQTRFNLMTILRKQMTGGSFHRIDSTLKDDSDGRLTLSVPKLRTAANTYVSGSATNNGNYKISLEELESGISDNSNSQLKVTPYESAGGEYKQDLITGAFTTISYAHHEIHSGSHFFTGNYTTLANGAVYDILFVTPNTLAYSHMIFEIATEAEAMFNYYEGTTTSADGTTLVMFDRNRITDNTPGTIFYHTPTIVTVGTEIGSGIFGSGKTQGGGLRDSNEIMLKPNTKYLMRVTNNTVSNNWYDWLFDWYEHVNR